MVRAMGMHGAMEANRTYPDQGREIVRFAT